VAHEFNNVLMSMQPFTELLQRPDCTPAVVAKAASHIANSIKRGKHVALDILRFTQPAEPKIVPIDLESWWNRFGPEIEALLGNDVQIASDFSEAGCVEADAVQFAQVLTNLVANARDAMAGIGGKLTVCARVPHPEEVFP